MDRNDDGIGDGRSIIVRSVPISGPSFVIKICTTVFLLVVGTWPPLLATALVVNNPTANRTARQVSIELTTSEDPVDFRFAILPILESRCFECHAGPNVEGDLRLDSEVGFQAGGHTGNAILATTSEASELYRRVTSIENGYRMPKEGPPLSPEQIDLFRRWIEQGGRWADPETVAPAAATWTEYLGGQLNRFSESIAEPESRFVWLLTWPMAVWLILTIASYGARNRLKKNVAALPQEKIPPGIRTTVMSGITFLLAQFGPLRQLISLMMLLMLAGLLYQAGVNGVLKTLNQRLLSTQETKRKSMKVSLDPQNLTLPPYPMHPARLGGLYYRGNDERSPDLFNGGFYRTATFELGIMDDTGRRLQIGDACPAGNVFVSLIVNRAPGTTAALFSEQVLTSTFLRHFSESKRVSDAKFDSAIEIPLIEIEPEQKWQANVSLGPTDDWVDGRVEGMVYLFYGNQKIDGHKGRVHFGIKYRLEIQAGVIAVPSELWMGSLYDLGGRVLVPGEGEILLDRWFDFRPIPEIEGVNTTDPELLGIPEHVNGTIGK